MREAMQSGAAFSACRTYRYALWRDWDSALPRVTFIGLNPSSADEAQDDPTIRRCIGFARRWGYGSLAVVNLFAYRCSDPARLKAAPDPVGEDADGWIGHWVAKASLAVVCWGNHGGHLGRDRGVLSLVPSPHCLRLTRRGYPAHPLYLPYRLKPVPFQAGSYPGAGQLTA